MTRSESQPASHPALVAGAVAVITGGASGIGFAAAHAFVRRGMNVCIADLAGERLSRAATAPSAKT